MGGRRVRVKTRDDHYGWGQHEGVNFKVGDVVIPSSCTGGGGQPRDVVGVPGLGNGFPFRFVQRYFVLWSIPFLNPRDILFQYEERGRGMIIYEVNAFVSIIS